MTCSISTADQFIRQDLYMLVESLHKIGVCHCDISLQNVVKGRNGVYKLIDFSLSSVHECPELYSVSTHEWSLSSYHANWNPGSEAIYS